MPEIRSTNRIKKLVVAIISVILILVTTISYAALNEVFAEGEEDPAAETVQQEPEAAQTEEAAGEQQAEGQTEGQPAEQEGAQTDGQEAGQTEGQQAEGQTEGQPAEGEQTQQQEEQPAEEQKQEEPEPELGTYMPEVSSSSYIVMSGSTSEVVLEKHDERKMQPGCITMLMTAMVVIDNMYNDAELNNTVDINKKLSKLDGSFKKGETVSVGDLLSAMLVGGSEQAAEALASYSSSTRDIFINEMNSKCMELGIMDTQFANPTGEYSVAQYSTAKDLAVITQAAFRYQKIQELLELKTVTVTARTKSSAREVIITSTDPLISDDADKAYKYADGGIAGSIGSPVNAAQYAGAATKGDMQLIVILMDSYPGSYAAEARGLLAYADTKVTRNTIVKKGKKVGHVRIRNGAYTRVAAYTEREGFAYVPPEGSQALIQTEVVLYKGLEAPMKKGDKVGEYRIYVADELKGTVDLVIKKDVPTGWFPSKIYISNLATIIICAILLLIAALLLRVRQVKIRRARRREAMRRQKIRALARQQLEIDEDRRKRDWNGRTGYTPQMPRTTDIRRETQLRETQLRQVTRDKPKK